MYPPSQAAYDRAITVFSPDGRLFQVEYAREAVRTGSTSIGYTCNDGLVLLAHKRIPSILTIGSSHEKIFKLDQHIIAASSGLIADARKLVDFARLECQRHRLLYSEEIPVDLLSKKVGDHIQTMTQYGGVRPYGVSLLIGGMNDRAHLFETDPSGAIFEYKATAIGSGKKVVEEFFEKEYQEKASIQDAIKLSVKAMKKAVEEKISAGILDLAVVSKVDKKTKIFTADEIAKYL